MIGIISNKDKHNYVEIIACAAVYVVGPTSLFSLLKTSRLSPKIYLMRFDPDAPAVSGFLPNGWAAKAAENAVRGRSDIEWWQSWWLAQNAADAWCTRSLKLKPWQPVGKEEGNKETMLTVK